MSQVAAIINREDGSAGGGWGEECRAVRAKIEASPAACIGRGRSQQKNFLFLLEEKIRRAQNQKCRENFFAGWRALASGGGAASFVGGLPEMRSDFVQGVEPNRTRRHENFVLSFVDLVVFGLRMKVGFLEDFRIDMAKNSVSCCST